MQNKTKIKILLNLIVLGLIISGIVIISTKGINVALDFGAKNKIQIPLEQEFNNKEIQLIAKEALGNDKNIYVTKVEVYRDIIQIESDIISNEEKNAIISKINEKYQKEINQDEIEIEYVANTRLLDIVTPYIAQFVISFGIILVYMGIKFRKQNGILVIVKMGATIIILELLLISIYAITRIGVDRVAFANGLILYVISVMVGTYILENENKKIRLELELKAKKINKE